MDNAFNARVKNKKPAKKTCKRRGTGGRGGPLTVTWVRLVVPMVFCDLTQAVASVCFFCLSVNHVLNVCCFRFAFVLFVCCYSAVSVFVCASRRGFEKTSCVSLFCDLLCLCCGFSVLPVCLLASVSQHGMGKVSQLISSTPPVYSLYSSVSVAIFPLLSV